MLRLTYRNFVDCSIRTMVAKRNLSASKSPSPNAKGTGKSSGKKRKISSSNQGTLDSFFNRSPSKLRIAPLTSSSAGASSSKVTLEDTAKDEALALRLAKEDGLSIDSVRKMEKMWKSTIPVTSSNEIIDLEEFTALHFGDGADSNSNVAGRLPEDERRPRTVKTGKMESEKPQIFDKSLSLPVKDISYPALLEDSLLFSTSTCPWVPVGPTPYSFLSHTLSSLSETRSRIAISNILTNCFRCIIAHDPPSLLPALYLLSNSLAPAYIPIELGVGHSVLSKAIQHVSGLTPAALRRLYTKKGDAGDVAFEAKSNLRTLVPHPPLTVSGVYNSFLKICRCKGDGSTKQKQSIVERLLVAAKGEETRYLVRMLVQHIRVGAVRASILTALARAMVLTRPSEVPPPPDDSPFYTPPLLLSKVEAVSGKSKKRNEEDPIRAEVIAKFNNAENLLKKVYVQHPNYDHIASGLLDFGLEGLAEHVTLTVGIPLHPTLGSPMRSLDEVYERLSGLPFTAEFKYDGQRAQIHAWKDEDGGVVVKMFSRHLEDMTDKYPDVVLLTTNMLHEQQGTSSFVMDTEVVAVDPKDGALKTFQELSNRARKDVRLEDVKVTVCVFAFDLMYVNGQSLLEESFRERRNRLRSKFSPVLNQGSEYSARFAHVESCESDEGREAVEEFWGSAVEGHSEGLMIKLLDSGTVIEDNGNSKNGGRRKPLPATYEPDKRTSAWLKLKKDYVLGLGDSLDLVPIGAWHGNGRKADWWSPILLALWDESIGQLVAVCKCISGFKDEFYKSLNKRYPRDSETCSKISQWNVNTGGYSPSVYFKPQEVWEIKGADITLSPTSVAAFGLINFERGLSLRFPRFIRVREDKSIHDASTPQFLATMFRKQYGKSKDTKAIDDGELVDVSPEASEEELDEYE